MFLFICIEFVVYLTTQSLAQTADRHNAGLHDDQRTGKDTEGNDRGLARFLLERLRKNAEDLDKEPPD